MSAKSAARLPGSVVFAYCSAWGTALSQALVESRMQVSMIEEKPASLPPMVMLTSVVDALRDESWLLMTLLVVAPEHAANVKEAGELADAHRGP
jgi:hypothetical protein